MKEIFIGRPFHWLLWVMVLVVLFLVGRNQIHTTNYFVFISILAALAAVSVLTVVLTYRKGERITREPLDDD